MNYEQLDLQILKIILSNKRYALDFISQYNEKLFMSDLWRFTKIIFDYVKVYKNVPTQRIILEKCKKNETLTKYVNEVYDAINKLQYDEKEYVYDLDKLKNRFSQKLIKNLKDKITSTDEDLGQNIGEVKNVLNNINAINKSRVYEQADLKEAIDDFRNRYIAKMNNPDFGVGIKMGYSFLDMMLLGLRPGELFLFGGSTGSGKSILLMGTGLNMWLNDNTIDMESNFKKGYNIIYFSLEMGMDDYMERIIARLAMVPQKSIQMASLTPEEEDRVAKAVKFIKNYPHYFEIIDLPRRCTIETIENVINDITNKKGKPDVVVIDYLNLMSVDDDNIDQDWLSQARISEQIHELGRAYNLVMLSAVQISQPKIKEDEEIGVHLLKRSKQIADNCNFLALLNKRKDEKNYPDMEIMLVKSRRTSYVSGKLQKKLDCCAVLDMPFEENTDQDDISGRIGD